MAARQPAKPRNRPDFPTSARVHALYDELLQRPRVTGCFVGRKRSKGRETRDLAVVCAVEEKLPDQALEAGHRIPGELRWHRNSREQVSLATDVQEGGESGFQAAPPAAGPGDTLASIAFFNLPARVTVSAVGVAMRHPNFGPVITTAGHAVQGGPGTVTFPPGQRPVVRLQNVRDDGTRTEFAGEVVRSARIQEADYALIVPTDGMPVRNLYHDVDTLSGLYVPQPADVGKTFFALTPGGLVRAPLRGVFGVFTVDGFPMRDLLLTDFVTQAGDSGCALIDSSFRICGLLVGFTTVDGNLRSVFMSAFWALNLENSELF